MTPQPRRDETRPQRFVDARLHLLDRQILDVDGVPVATVDDLELSGISSNAAIEPGAAAPRIEAILTGPVLATRIFGGRAPKSRRHSIAWTDVARISVTIHLRVRGDTLDATWTERWVRDHVIAHIPGGRHAPD